MAETDWQTAAEKSAFATTPNYADTLAYLERLTKAAPNKLHLERFGTTGEGRPMMVVVASGSGVFTPEAARAAHVPIVLVQAGIHSGEIEGKDAGLALLRDFAVTGKLPHLLDRAVLVFIPVYNIDGHEKTSPYNRINQNGPSEMGFRGQAQYLNLNRDYVKADAPETRAWLKLWQHWRPDFLIDVHTTDGADYQYDLTWYLEDPHKLYPAVSQWQQQAMVQVTPAYEARGHLASIYLEFRDGTDPTKGIVNFGSGARFSTGYAALQNRPALLIETHMLKSYAVRVQATYDLVSLLLDYAGQHGAELVKANAEADATTIARAKSPAAEVAITYKPDPATTDYALKGYAYTVTHSDVSGGNWIQYDPKTPKTYTIPNANGLLPDISITPPVAYVVPAQWTDVIARLEAHGLRMERLSCSVKLRGTSYQIDDPVWAERPFEGHHVLQSFKASRVTRQDVLPPGSVVVPMDQPGANVAIELLEPEAPDSLLRWGYLDATFEPKEYGEPRVVEKLARDMLQHSPKLAAEFADKLKSDPAFAASPRARLEFFFERSPWYAAQDVGRYPVLGVDRKALESKLCEG
ncbi:MAG TPA: M14 family metallopeptidase [Rhizomicrobium sp.]|nr:M14 family metallopeptidase [Rhizomicrobium sp.]